MPPPLPEHLFEQADRITTTIVDPPQTDLRRAISNAYYGLFHFALTAAADMIVGSAENATPRYALVYRSVDHLRLRALCVQVSGTKPLNVAFAPNDEFGSIADFARLTRNLYDLRILADYDPSREFNLAEARLAVSNAREAIRFFQQGSPEQQQAFLTLLLFKQR